MKKTSFIFTKSRMGLDNSVWLTMLLILITSLFIFGFKAITKVNCSLDAVKVAGIKQQTNNIFSPGEPITFSISAKPGDKIEWNFDDGTALQKGGKVIQHSFLKEGSFNVSCIVNDKCIQSVFLNIIFASVKSNDSELVIGNPIIGMDTVTAGTNVHYSTLIKANYQWSSSASPDIQTTQGADFTFYKEGPQMITLKIDGAKSYTKPVVVVFKKSSDVSKSPGINEPIKPIPIPPAINSVTPVSGGPGTIVTITGSFFAGTKSVSFGGIEAKFQVVSSTEITAIIGQGASGPVTVITDVSPTTFTNPSFTYIPPAASTTPSSTQSTSSAPEKKKINDDMLKKMLVKVVNNEWHADNFNQYFCSGTNTLVYANSDNKPTSFAAFCQSIQGQKVEIESAQIIPDPSNPDCEMNLKVTYKKNGVGFFKRILSGKKVKAPN